MTQYVTECIAEGILKDFLERNRMEARAVSIYEYDREAHIRMERQEAFEEGRLAELSEAIQKKLIKGKSIEQISEELEKEVSVIVEIIEKNHLK